MGASRVVGIDPAAHTGLAVLGRDERGRPRVVSHEVILLDGKKGEPPAQAVDRVTRRFDPADVAVVAIEEQFLGKSPSTLVKLVETRTRWMQAFEALGHRVILVRPETWAKSSISGMPGGGGTMHAGAKREIRKAAAKAWVKAVYGVDVGEDEADAICIGHHAMSTGA